MARARVCAIIVGDKLFHGLRFIWPDRPYRVPEASADR
jgi:hypothetical protein